MSDPATDLMREMRRILHDAGGLEQRVQRAVAEYATAPFDAVFDLLAESGTMLERQADALEAAAGALGEAAALMKTQAQLFERSIQTIRQPLEVGEGVAGVERKKR